MDPRGSIYTQNDKINKSDKWNAYMHWEFIFITSSRSKQKLNVTPGLEHCNESRWAHVAFFSNVDNRHERSAMAYFFKNFLHEQHKQYISFPFLQHIDLKTYQQQLARSGWQRWNVAFIHCLSASVRTKTSGRCMVVQSLQKWCTLKQLLTKNKTKQNQSFPHLIFW